MELLSTGIIESELVRVGVNLRRRQLSVFQRVEMGYILEGMQKEMTKRRRYLGGL
ncbi:MAG: hypothetical protein WA667_27245 [Candidatus Nitrosopolaris sp.]